MIDYRILERVLEKALSKGGSFAELFIEDSYTSSISLESGKIDKAISGRDKGVGLRVFHEEKCLYAYTNSFLEKDLLEIAIVLSNGIAEKHNVDILKLNEIKDKKIHTIKIPPFTVNKNEKVQLLNEAYEAARNYDKCIVQATASYMDKERNIAIANSEGLFKQDKRTRCRLAIRSIAENNQTMQTGYIAPGGLMGFEFFKEGQPEKWGREASRIAKTMASAEYCPAGNFPVIIDNGFGGVLFHEACGHGLEATSLVKGASVFSGKIGEMVASPIVTAIDDGTIKNAWGSILFDDEGNEGRKNILIENGVLKGYLVDKFNGIKMDYKPTGSSRRQSYKYAPTSRMTNTYIAKGNSKKEELIENTEYGLYATKMGGGSVNPTTGEFNFSVMEGYIIEKGKIIRPVRGATLVGTGIEVLKNIDMVADNLEFGQGVCGSKSGHVPTNVGQPTIRIKSMTVGGR